MTQSEKPSVSETLKDSQEAINPQTMDENPPKKTDQIAENPSDSKKTKKPVSNLVLRVLSAVVLLAVVLPFVVFSNAAAWGGFCLLIAILGGWEFMKITCGQESRATRAVSVVLALIPVVTAWCVLGFHAPFLKIYSLHIFGASCAVCVWGAFLFNCFRPRVIERASHVICATLACASYVGLTCLFLALFKRDLGSDAVAWIFTLMAMTWLSDTGAYFTGRAFGKHKMAPILSPKKSIEGAIGGFACALITAFVANALCFNLSPLQVIVFAIVANFLAQMGDLSESLLKRSFAVKDSGNIIPGHGGVLDRVDALIFSAPWVYLFALMTR